MMADKDICRSVGKGSARAVVSAITQLRSPAPHSALLLGHHMHHAFPRS